MRHSGSISSKLDFIVLDEAHSYMGAQAAEVSLLLRRVALAFGRTPDQIRYIATSATLEGLMRRPIFIAFYRTYRVRLLDAIHVVEGCRAQLPPAAGHALRTVTLHPQMCQAWIPSTVVGCWPVVARCACARRIKRRKIFSWRGWTEKASATWPVVLLMQHDCSSRLPAQRPVRRADHGSERQRLDTS